MKTLIRLRNNLTGFLYRHVLKKALFKIDPERVHNDAVLTGEILGSNFLFRKAVALFFGFSDKSLEQNIGGIRFRNPVGLAAGFDKDARIIKIMPAVGFGFTEIGSVTGEYCPGNPRPRLWRLPESRAIVVHYGLNNAGAEAIAKRLAGKKGLNDIPLGINVAKTNSPEVVGIEKEINDYLKVIRLFSGIGDYLTINISCPNVYGGQPFTEPGRLDRLLSEIDKFDLRKPVFLKLPPDISLDLVDKIIELSASRRIFGFICSNLTKDRSKAEVEPKEANLAPTDIGGISGKPTEKMANSQIAYIYQKTKGEKIIIGCGGIFSAEDAYKKIKLGASLVQLITGMIFEGPQVISEINLGLCRLLRRDGFKNISQAIGADSK
jgi:dihydroorotate dehydrogenase